MKNSKPDYTKDQDTVLAGIERSVNYWGFSWVLHVRQPDVASVGIDLPKK